MADYIQHGRRHGPNGSDPIPGSSYGREVRAPGTPVTIADGTGEFITWGVGAGVVLDYTDPFHPVVIESGVYAVTVNVAPAALTVGGLFTLTLLLDVGGVGVAVDQDSTLSTAAYTEPHSSCAATYYIPAGNGIDVFVHSYDGASSQDFYLSAASVQRLS